MITADLSPRGDRIDVRFPYDRSLVAAVKAIPGARFIGPDKADGPCWRLPLDLRSGQALRQAAPGLRLTPELIAWGQKERRTEERLTTLATAVDAELALLPNVHPALGSWLRPYQRADVAFMSAREHVLNANRPGLGKTVETIASVYESGAGDGRHLIIAGITSMDVVWGDQLRQWGANVHVAQGSPAARQATIDAAAADIRNGLDVWLVVNPAMVQLRAEYDTSTGKKVEVATHAPYPLLADITWDTVIMDEFHTMGLSNTKTLTRRGLTALRSNRRIVLSGTPIGGRPIKLWAVLNYLHPQIFTSKWTWAERWLEMLENPYADSGREIGNRIKPGLEEEFYNYHSQFMVRRTKAEVMQDLPEKNVIDVWCEMTGPQAQQYAELEAEAEIRIDGEAVSVTNVLSEYLRLRQLAGTECTITDGTLWPTARGCKVEQLDRILEEHGLAADRDGTEQAIVFTQFTKLANVLAGHLQAKGLRVRMITGETSADDRSSAVRDFEAGGLIDVLVMNVKAGGTALTLNRSDLIVFMDETWNPDDQLQAEERNRNNSADIYYLRTRASVDEDVHEVTAGKTVVNRQVLDQIRQNRSAR